MKKYYLTTTLFFSLLFSNYLDVQFASFSYTIGGSYGSCVKFKKSEYSFSDFNECSCAWAANISSYPDCYELFYNPQTKMIKYNLSEGGEYIYRSFSSDYTCHLYNEEIQMPECSEMNQIGCINEDSCQWINDIEIGDCSDITNSSECYQTNQCLWYNAGNYGYWYDNCYGGTYEIDNSYCQEDIMPECSNMNQLQCINENSCSWIEDYEWSNCSSYDSAVECSWANDNGGNCDWSWNSTEWQDTCSGGSFQLDTSYCEEIDYLIGDINSDSIINILDVIETINIILDNNYDVIVDMDNDQQVNVLDVIQLINIILNN